MSESESKFEISREDGAINIGYSVIAFLEGIQLNSISTMSEKTFTLVNLLVTTAADCLLPPSAARQTTNPVCWPFALSLSHSCMLLTLDVLHIQSAFNLLNLTFLPLWPKETGPSAIKPHIWSTGVWI